jgi:cellulose synthase/poly-beta-1,6-N-acetylglucosamine synthase-like glycosyltransferase
MRESGPVRISVIVPTFRRAVYLRRCLTALRRQERLPEEVIVVIRAGDAQTEEVRVSSEFGPLPLRWLETTEGGAVAAENAALKLATGDILAFTDDDAAPRPDWLRRIEAHFLADPQLGGLGGRDWMYRGDSLAQGSKRDVNRVQWFGRLVGNNHLGVGPPREVDMLKGVNMSFRRLAIGGIRFDDRLRGNGAQVHLDHSFAMAVKRAGWKLVYDPEVAVDHYLAPRADEDQRIGFNALAYRNSVHNQTLGMLDHLPPFRRTVFLGYAILVGTWAAPGLVQWVRMQLRGFEAPGGRLIASLRGRWDAWETWRRSRDSERTTG